MFGTLADIRNELRVRLGLPDRGDSGDTRLNTMINMALRQMWSEMPKALLSQEMRFMLEAPIRTTQDVTIGGLVEKKSTVFFDPADNKVLKQDLVLIADLWPIDGTLGARTIEILVDGTYYRRRIQSVYSSNIGSPTHYAQYCVLNAPLDIPLNASPGYEYRIYTEEYPYPASVQQVVDVIIDPDSNPHTLIDSVFQAELTNYRATIGFRSEGRPELYTRGDFYQLESPNYKPKVRASKENVTWGFNAGVEQNTQFAGSTATKNAGPSGKFQYIVMHVWGRRPFYDLTYNNNGVGGSTTQLLPFYQSAPSKESDEITSSWGMNGIEIITPNIDYVYGYGEQPSRASYHKFGYEKFIFRKRISVSEPKQNPNVNGPAPTVEEVEADSIYYLWKVTPGHQTSAIDDGNSDPVDRRFSLEAFNGHFHIKFDRLPTSETPVLLRTFSRPPLLRYDTDTPRIPPECYDALYALTASYLTGDRDGEPARKSLYFQEYQVHLKRLRKTYNLAGHQVGSFGNGLSGGRSIGFRRNKTITEKT